MRRLEDDSPTEPAPPADPRDVKPDKVGTPVRDAAVNPQPGDFLAPVDAGKADPHGPEVVSPGLHANQDQRPVKPKAVRDPASLQQADETADLRRRLRQPGR